MPNRDIGRNLMALSVSLRDVIARLNQGVLGVVFLVDDGGVLRGVMTDGDVRRALLAGATLDAAAADHMTRSFASGHASAARTANLALLSQRIRHLPILDDGGRPVDMLCWADVWRLPVAEPSLSHKEVDYVLDCLRSNWISSQGPYVTRFQDAFAARHGVAHALATTNGTAALHLALVALGVGPGDEVIVPDITFGASANAVIHAGARPVFVDIDPRTWTMTAEAVTRRVTGATRAIMPVHLYGHPCDMDPILELARARGLAVVEDCAEALGATYKGRPVGALGTVGCFSFFANKVITTGEGGMVTTDDHGLHERMIKLRDHGMARDRKYWHDEAGFNYRMTNMQAAVGLAQLERLDAILDHRRALAGRYARRLAGVDGLGLPGCAPWSDTIPWLYVVTVEPAVLALDKDTLAARLAEDGIETRGVFYPLHLQPAYARAGQGNEPFPASEHLAETGLCLPLGNGLGLDQVDHICDRLIDIVGDAAVLARHRSPAARRAGA